MVDLDGGAAKPTMAADLPPMPTFNKQLLEQWG